VSGWDSRRDDVRDVPRPARKCFCAGSWAGLPVAFQRIWLRLGWGSIGPLVDGRRFDPAAAPGIREKILGFWRDFHAGAQDLAIEVRGTNFTTGAAPRRRIGLLSSCHGPANSDMICMSESRTGTTQ